MPGQAAHGNLAALVLGAKRASYGEEILALSSAKLVEDFGNGFGRRNLFNMVRFAEVFPEQEIMHALSAQWG
jgi:DUF1016 N-terminal domain